MTTHSISRPRAAAWIAAVAAVCALALSGCSVVDDLKGVSEAGTTFAATIVKGDAAGAAAMMHPKALASGDMAAGIQQVFIGQKFSDPVITGTSISNGIGELTGTCKLQGNSGTLSLQLEKDGGTWKVLNINCKIN